MFRLFNECATFSARWNKYFHCEILKDLEVNDSSVTFAASEINSSTSRSQKIFNGLTSTELLHRLLCSKTNCATWHERAHARRQNISVPSDENGVLRRGVLFFINQPKVFVQFYKNEWPCLNAPRMRAFFQPEQWRYSRDGGQLIERCQNRDRRERRNPTCGAILAPSEKLSGGHP